MERGTDDLALNLDGDIVGGVLLRGGGLQRWRLHSDVVFGGDGDDAGLDGWRRVTGGAASLVTPSGGLTKDASPNQMGKMAMGLT